MYTCLPFHSLYLNTSILPYTQWDCKDVKKKRFLTIPCNKYTFSLNNGTELLKQIFFWNAFQISFINVRVYCKVENDWCHSKPYSINVFLWDTMNALICFTYMKITACAFTNKLWAVQTSLMATFFLKIWLPWLITLESTLTLTFFSVIDFDFYPRPMRGNGQTSVVTVKPL